MRAYSGSMYPMVPTTKVDVWVFVAQRFLAMPKSVRWGSMSLSRRMFDGLTSRWMILGLQSWWRYASP